MRALSPRLAAIAALVGSVSSSSVALAVGESKDGFPSWAERVLHEWANRARVEPALEMAKCGAKCGEAACYSAATPLYYNEKANHAARFHAAHMDKNGYFAHDSKCALVPDIATLFPASCDGSAACACQGGTLTGTTGWSARVKLFGPSASAEIIASPADPNSAFYLWLYENSPDPTCKYSASNGHRWSLLTNKSTVGFGVSGNAVGDFGSGGDAPYPIASGSHYPASGANVELWANWSDAAGPKSALVNVDGACQPMKLTRGKPENGAYLATPSGLGTCSRYYFRFEKADGTEVTYPSTGSLGIGDAACLEWSATRPSAGAGCNCAPSCAGKVCGDDGCGGDCGACTGGTVCDGAGQCGCAVGTTACPSGCVDTTTDAANCGGCGQACDPGVSCVGGGCQPASGTGGGGQAGSGGAGGEGGGAAGASMGGTSAGGTSAGGTSAGGTSAGGTSAGGTSAGGTAGSSGGAGGKAGNGASGAAGKSGAGGASGKAGAGGASGKGGAAGAKSGAGGGGTGGAAGGSSAAASDDTGGCGCRVDARSLRAGWGLSILVAFAALARRSRRAGGRDPRRH